MKVKVTGWSHGSQWYKDRQGEVFEVIEHKKDADWWEVLEKEEPHITRLIRKDHAEIVKQ